MVNLDQSMDRLSLMHDGGLLPGIHSLQISSVDSHGPSSTSSDDKSGGNDGCLVLGCDVKVCVCLRVFLLY